MSRADLDPRFFTLSSETRHDYNSHRNSTYTGHASKRLKNSTQTKSEEYMKDMIDYTTQPKNMHACTIRR